MSTFPNGAYSLSPRRFLEDEEIPVVRSIIKLQLPNPILGPGSLHSVPAVFGATQANYHSALVRYSIPDYARRCIVISVWPIPAYSSAVFSASSPAGWMRDQPQLFRDANIPFPCQQDTHDPRPPPAQFGAPITLPHFRDRLPSWILMEAQTFDLPFSKAWKCYVPTVRVSVADMSRIESYSTVPTGPHPPAVQVSLTMLPQAASIETSLFARMFGTDPVIRLGSSDGDSNNDDVLHEDDDDGDGMQFLRLLAPRSKVISEVLDKHQREAAEQRNEIVRRWIEGLT